MQLNNGLVEFDFDDANGNLRRIKDLKNGKEYLRDPRGHRLVKLIAPTAAYSSRPLYSHLAGAPRMRKKGPTLTIVFPAMSDGGQATGISMRVKVCLPPGRPEAIFTLQLRNDGPDMVQEAWFPWIGGHHLKAGEQREKFTTSTHLPNFSRAFPTIRAHAFGRHHQRVGFEAWLPMLDVSDARGGLSYIRYENKTSYNALVFENESADYTNLCMSWAWVSLPFLKTGQSWTSAEFGVGVHQGDWHATADRLRSYMETWWKPSGMPPALRERIGLYHVQFHGFNGERYNEFEALPDMARDCLKYGISDICLWDVAAQVYLRPDRGGFWEMAPERLASLQRALAESRRLGCLVGAWINFRLITEYTRLWKQLQPFAFRSIFDKLVIDNWTCSMNHAIYGNQLMGQAGHALCLGSDGYRKFASDLLERTLGLGFSTLYIDQTGECHSCLAENHGHKTPDEALARTCAWFAEATRRVRARHPQAYTVGECREHLMHNTQSVDLWWDWGWRNTGGHLFRYLIPESMACWCIDENERDVLGKAFAMGNFLAIATRDMTGKLSDEPELARQIARLAKLRKSTAPFVSHGRFMDNRGLSVENGDAYVFSSAAGLAVAMANGEPRQSTLKIALRPEEIGLVPAGKGLLHMEGAEPAPISPRRRGGNWSVEVKVPSYGAAIWTMAR